MERKGQALQVGHWCRGWEGPWLTLVDLSNFWQFDMIFLRVEWILDDEIARACPCNGFVWYLQDSFFSFAWLERVLDWMIKKVEKQHMMYKNLELEGCRSYVLPYYWRLLDLLVSLRYHDCDSDWDTLSAEQKHLQTHLSNEHNPRCLGVCRGLYTCWSYT